MAEGEASERVILQLRAVLRGISPLIWRRLLVPSDSTIAQLHDVLQVAFGWDDMHLQLRRMERFTYECDFGDSWVHDTRIEATLPIDPAKRYPVCVAGKCSAPPEDCGGPDVFMENRWQYETMGSGESREELDGLIDDVEEEEWEIVRRYHPGGFDRRAINQTLSALASSA